MPGFGAPFSKAEDYYLAWVHAEERHIGAKPVVNQEFPSRLAKIAPKIVNVK